MAPKTTPAPAADPDMFTTGGGTDEMLTALDDIKTTLSGFADTLAELKTHAAATRSQVAELTDLVVKLSLAKPAPAAAAGPAADGGSKSFDAKVALFMEEAKPRAGGGGTWTQCTATFIPLKDGVLNTAQPWRRTFGKFPGPSTEIATTLDKAFKAGSMVRVYEAPSKKDPKYHDIVRVEVL